MLQTIREQTQGWIAGVIISIIILTFALWGIHSYFQGGENNQTIAEVNGVDISRQAFAAAYERVRRQIQLQRGPTNPLNQQEETALKDRTLTSLIDLEVLKQAAVKEGFVVSSVQLDNFLQTLSEFQVNGQFSIDRFQEILAANMLSAGEFLDLMQGTLLINQPKQGIFFTAFSLPNETNNAISLVNQEREIEYLHLPLEYFLATPITISPDATKAYYAKHKNEFMTPEQVSVEYVELNVKDIGSDMQPSEAALQSFYNENASAYTQPAQWKLMNIELTVPADASQEDLQVVEKKAEAAKEALARGADISKIPDAHLGVLNGQSYLTLNQIPAELQKTIVAELTQAGQVTDPIKTQNGFTIVKAIDVKQPAVQPYEQVAEKVKQAYIKQHADEKFQELREQLADLAYEHPDSLQPAAKKLNLAIKQTGTFSRDKGGSDISQYAKVRNIAFTNDVMNSQNNSDVIQVSPEAAVAIRVKTHTQASYQPIETVTKLIEGKLKTREAEKRADQLVNQIEAQLQKGANPEQIAAANKLLWNKPGSLGRYADKVPSAILDQAFRLPNPTGTKNKVIYAKVRLPNGYAIVALKAIKTGQQDKAKEYAAFAEQQQNSEGLLEYELYKQSQVKRASIKFHN